MPDTVAAVRRFNRFYTRAIGALDAAHLGSPYSLAEMRVLHEIAQAADGVTHKALLALTDLDPGYLSRIVKRFEREGLVERHASPTDARSRPTRLTSEGAKTYCAWRAVAEGAVEDLVAPLSPVQKTELTAAMAQVEALLGGDGDGDGEVILRDPLPGDLGWVVSRHGALYAREQGWDLRFEALVAGIVADFVRDFDPARERCWIAERGGERLGSIFLVKGARPGQAKLRLLLLEPAARGLGLGKRLVEACIAFARAAGYDELTLWTQSQLKAARRIYAGAGFQLTATSPNEALAPGLVDETWTLKLS